jgi:hypothetical protein
MGYLARIRKGEARDAMGSTITTIEKTQAHGTILILWRLLARPEVKKLLVFTTIQ